MHSIKLIQDTRVTINYLYCTKHIARIHLSCAISLGTFNNALANVVLVFKTEHGATT